MDIQTKHLLFANQQKHLSRYDIDISSLTVCVSVVSYNERKVVTGIV